RGSRTVRSIVLVLPSPTGFAMAFLWADFAGVGPSHAVADHFHPLGTPSSRRPRARSRPAGVRQAEESDSRARSNTSGYLSGDPRRPTHLRARNAPRRHDVSRTTTHRFSRTQGVAVRRPDYSPGSSTAAGPARAT